MKSCKVIGNEVNIETTEETMKIAGFWDVTGHEVLIGNWIH
jgi:hypothetical protein